MPNIKEIQAIKIVATLKKVLLDILWSNFKDRYNENKTILPWLQEEAEYKIKKLKLPAKKEAFYLTKIERVMGEYFEE